MTLQPVDNLCIMQHPTEPGYVVRQTCASLRVDVKRPVEQEARHKRAFRFLRNKMPRLSWRDATILLKLAHARTFWSADGKRTAG
jgi:hypothetical protein